jgi:hypothetical protein
LIDVHSYPNSFSSFNVYPVPELVILDSYHSDQGFIDLFTSVNFVSYLKSQGIDAVLLEGGDNDIMIEMRENGIPAILLEFNESLSSERINTIVQVISNYLKQ